MPSIGSISLLLKIEPLGVRPEWVSAHAAEKAKQKTLVVKGSNSSSVEGRTQQDTTAQHVHIHTRHTIPSYNIGTQWARFHIEQCSGHKPVPAVYSRGVSPHCYTNIP